VLPQTFLCSAEVIPSPRPCTKPVLPRAGGVKDGAATAKGGLSLTAPSTVACWMLLGPRKFFDAARRALLLFGMDTAALPVWDEEDEAEQSEGRPYRCSYGRHKQEIDLTSSFVPRGTPSARGGGNQSLRLSVYSSLAVPSGRGSLLLRPAELRAVNPDAVHDDGKPARQRHDCPLQPAVPGDLHGPSFEP
jgi:hypothetical protein